MQTQLLADTLQGRFIEDSIHIEPLQLPRRGQIPAILEINKTSSVSVGIAVILTILPDPLRVVVTIEVKEDRGQIFAIGYRDVIEATDVSRWSLGTVR
jgi:hypothetical protein